MMEANIDQTENGLGGQWHIATRRRARLCSARPRPRLVKHVACILRLF